MHFAAKKDVGVCLFGSVVVPHFAVVHRRAGLGIGNVALFHHGIDDPVVGAFHPLFHQAAQKGQGIGEHRAAIGVSFQHIHPGETIGTGGEALEEMPH